MRVVGSSQTRHENDTHHRINSTKKAPSDGAFEGILAADGVVHLRLNESKR